MDFSGAENFVSQWSGQGSTLVGLAVEKSLLGLFAVNDTVKPGSAKVIEQLHRQGLKSFLVTGDNTLTALSIAQQVGIKPENVFAEVRPEQKAEFVKKLQQRGERVAFAGEGINDGPALEQSDLARIFHGRILFLRFADFGSEKLFSLLLFLEIKHSVCRWTCF